MFKIIDDILTTKSGNSINRNDFDVEFHVYMIQRWLSIHSELNVDILNSTVNILYKTLDKEEHYKLLSRIIPPTNKRKKYIKGELKSSRQESDEVDISGYFEESSIKIEDSLKYVNGK